MIEMLEMWKNFMLREQEALIPEKPVHHSDNVMQTSFTLPEGAKIIFTNNKKTLEPVKQYNDLNEVWLTDDEKEIVEATSKVILKQPPPHNYDGDHLLISSVLYDHEKNALYIEAKKAKYSLLVSINQKKFPEDSQILQQDLYGAGANMPLVTTDGYTVLLQSSKYKSNEYKKNRFLTVAGYVQAKCKDALLLYPNGDSIVEGTATDELAEELLWNKEKSRLRVTYHQPLTVSSVLFKKAVGERGVIEFIVPVKLNCNHYALENLIRTNEAPDCDEHTGVYKLINLDPDEREANHYSVWSKNNPGGCDIYPTIIEAASRRDSKKLYGDRTQAVMPGSRGRAFPVSFFKPNPNRELSLLPSFDDNKVVEVRR